MALKPAQLQWSDTGILRSLDFDDVYFQPERGVEESAYVFLQQNRLAERFAALAPGELFHIAELGFGSGLNFLLTAQCWAAHAPEGAHLQYTSFEKHPITKEDLTAIYLFWPELQALSAPVLQQYPPLAEGMHRIALPGVSLNLVFGDVKDWLPEMTGEVDAWYLDGFAPAKNPQMWESLLYKEMFARTKAGGTFSTFSAAGAVKRGLEEAGFTVEKKQGFGSKRDMLTGMRPGTAPAYVHRARKATVLGAGLAGAAAAYALACRGWSVDVVDKHAAAGMETSGNPAGVLYQKMTVEPSAMGAWYTHGFSYTRHLAERFSLPSWNPCGVVMLPVSDKEEQRYDKLLEQAHPAAFIRREHGGLYQPMAGYLSPPELCCRLLEHPNIRIVTHREITSLQEAEGDAVVIALGHNSRMFPETEWLPLQSLRGQISYVTASPQSQALPRVICHEGYITPAIEGVHYIGATFQKEEPARPEIREEDHDANVENLNRYLPQLGLQRSNVVGGRTGYRSTTPDKLPLVGRVPLYGEFLDRFADLRLGKDVTTERPYLDNVYMATGFGAHGVSGAPLAGEVVAAMITGDPLPIPHWLQEYLVPERFILRDLKRRKI